MGAEAAPELALLAELPVAPALPVGEEPPLLLIALVIMEPLDIALGDKLADDHHEAEVLDDDEEEGQRVNNSSKMKETHAEEAEMTLLRDDCAEEGRPGAVGGPDMELVDALVVLAVDEVLSVALVLLAELEGAELGETVLRERLVVGAPRVTLEAMEEVVTSESIWKKGVKFIFVSGFESSTISTV